jgi:FecR-like protein
MTRRRAQGLFVGALALLFLAANSGARGARVVSAVGAVEVSSGEGSGWRPAQEGESLPRGSLVRTGAGARAELELEGASARIYERSLARIPADAEPGQRFDLAQGAASFNVVTRSDSPFEVRTPDTWALAKGTSFTVTADSGVSTVSVGRGLVGVRPSDSLAREILVHPGFGVTGGAGRPFALGLLDQKGDPWEAWLRGAAPSRPLPRPPESQLPPAAVDETEVMLQGTHDVSIQVIAGRGPKRVEVVSPEGIEVTLTRHDLYQVLRGNTASLGTRLIATLHERGVTPAAFAHQVLDNL